MCGKKWSRIVLLNPFRNEKVSYYFNTKNIMTLREYLYQDILTFNMNCMLAKNNNVRTKEVLEVENNLLTVVDNPNDPTQTVMIKFISPIKIDVVANLYASIDKEKADEKKEKYMLESKFSKEDMIEQVSKILDKNKKNVIFSYQDVDKLEIKKTKDVEEMVNEHTKSIVDLSLLDKSMYFILELFKTHRFI